MKKDILAIYSHSTNPHAKTDELVHEAFAYRYKEVAEIQTAEARSYTDILAGLRDGTYTYGIIPAVIGQTKSAEQCIGASMQEYEEIFKFWAMSIQSKEWGPAHIIAEERLYSLKSLRYAKFHFLCGKAGKNIFSGKTQPNRTIRIACLDTHTGSPEDIYFLLKMAKMETSIFEPMHVNTPGKSVFYIEYTSTAHALNSINSVWSMISPNMWNLGNFSSYQNARS